MASSKISIAIPTLDRGAVLVATIESLLAQEEAGEILVIDQTQNHPEEIAAQLGAWKECGVIRWLRLPEPSIPHAMNVGLREAAGDVVLFLDDDIVPGAGLIANHLANYEEADVVAVAGQVIQPWQSSTDMPRPRARSGIWEDLDFPFHSTSRAEVRNCIACNFSIRRNAAFGIGGFDENFIGAAYRFETEFCRRLARQGGRIIFDPLASVRHLKVENGGTRVLSDGVKNPSVEHSIGVYYFGLSQTRGLELLQFIAFTFIRRGTSRYFISRPWRIFSYLFCEVKAFWTARKLLHNRRIGRTNYV